MTVSVVNLKQVMTEWIIQQNDKPYQALFDRQAAKQHMRPGLSPWSESNGVRGRHKVTYALSIAPYFVIPTMAWAVLAIPVAQRRGRRAAVAVIVVFSIVLLLAAYKQRVVASLYPGSYACLGDYAYIPGVDLTSGNPRRGTTIAAYDIQSFQGLQRRVIAFADGHVVSLWDDQARPLFRANGLVFPE